MEVFLNGGFTVLLKKIVNYNIEFYLHKYVRVYMYTYE